MKASKYRSVITMCDNIKFASKAEAARYQELKTLQLTSQIKYFLRQVPFHLPANIKYVCDFFVVWSDGNITIEDVKGFKTQTYLLKKKLVEEYYKIKIVEIKK